MLRHPQGNMALPGRNDENRHHYLQNCRTLYRPKVQTPEPTARLARNSAKEDQFNLGLDPDTTQLPRQNPTAQARWHPCSCAGPNSTTWRSARKVRDYAAEMQEKSMVEKSAEIQARWPDRPFLTPTVT